MKTLVVGLLIIWAAELLKNSGGSPLASLAPNCEVPGLPYGTSVPGWMTGGSHLPLVENR